MDFDKLFKDNKRLFGIMADKIVDNDKKQDREDILQYLYLTTLELVPRYYDPKRGKLSTFLMNYVVRHAKLKYYENKGVCRLPHYQCGNNFEILYKSLDSCPAGLEENSYFNYIEGKYFSREYNLDEGIDIKRKKIELKHKLDLLPDRWKDILVKYYGINNNEPKTLKELGNEYNISPQRVQIIRDDSIKRLKGWMNNKEIN